MATDNPAEVRPRGSTQRTGALVLRGAIVLAVLALGLFARHPAPGVPPPGEDKALNARIFAALRAGEPLPAVDEKMLGPEGRRIADHMPLGLYRAMHVWRTLAPTWLRGEETGDRQRFGMALAALFVAALLWLGAETSGRWEGAVLTGLLAVAMPALAYRSNALWLRWELLGATALVGYVAASARGLRTGRAASAVAAVGLFVLAADAWRPALTLAVPCLAFGLLRLGSGRLRPEELRWLTATVLAVLTACLLPAYARSQGLLMSPVGALAATTGLALALRAARRARAWPIPDRALAAGAVVAAVGIVWLGRSAYSELGSLLVEQLRSLASSTGNRDAVGRLYATVAEFQPARSRFLTDPGWGLVRDELGLRVLALGLLAALVVRCRGLAGSGIERAFVAWLALVYVGLTILFDRSIVLAGPFVAASSAAVLLDAGSGWRTAHGVRRFSVYGVAALAGLTLVAALWQLPARRAEVGRPGPTLPLTVADEIHATTPPRAVIASAWNLGYELQWYAERASFTDGLLEDPENRRRILDVWAAGSLDPPEVFSARLRRAGATHALVGPPLDAALALLYMGYAVAPGISTLPGGGYEIDPRAPGAPPLVQMLGGGPVPGFRHLWSMRAEDGRKWTLYEIGRRPRADRANGRDSSS